MKYAFLLALLIPFTSSAAQWVGLTGGVGVSNSVDSNSIAVMKNGDRKAWIQYVYEKPQVTDDGKVYVRVMELALFKCNERRSVVIKQIKYSLSELGTIASDIELPEHQWVFNDVIPDSIGEEQFDFVCSFKQKKGKAV